VVRAKNRRECLGWIEVGERELRLIMSGTHVHFNPEFVVRAGWAASWINISLVVTRVAVRSHGNMTIYVSGWSDGNSHVTVDRDGRYVRDKHLNKVGANGAANSLRMLYLPMFRESGQLYCPYCGIPTVFRRGGAEFCEASNHGTMPDPDSGRVIGHSSIVAPNWVMETAPAERDRSVLRRADDRIGRRKRRQLPSGSVEGAVCSKCGAGKYEYIAGTLKCDNNICWHRPLVNK
jgi:uncharacterized Zn-finger protein